MPGEKNLLCSKRSMRSNMAEVEYNNNNNGAI